MTALPDRMGVAEVSQATGMTPRTVQHRAAAGLIPSAAKLGGTWSFDRATIRRWVRRSEGETACRATYTVETAPTGDGSRSRAGTFVAAYEQLIGRKRRGGSNSSLPR